MMSGIKVISKNRKAFHEYQILDSYEAGISLLGTEVKSIRAGKINLSDGWVDITGDDQAFLEQVHISPYSHGNRENHAEKRRRQLLLRKREIQRLGHEISAKGLTLVPIKVYFKGQHIKVEIALAKGKKLHDKRDATRDQEAKRQIQRALKVRQQSD